MTTRPEYRDPKKPKAVCVYTIAQESRYLIVENIPHLGVIDQLIQLCHSFGLVESHRPLDEISTDQTDVVLIQYAHVASARLAKRKLDDKPFFTQLLRVYYAPEYESLQDLRDKFQDRYQSVHARLYHPLKRAKEEKKRKAFVYTAKEPTQETVQPTENNQKKRRRI